MFKSEWSIEIHTDSQISVFKVISRKCCAQPGEQLINAGFCPWCSHLVFIMVMCDVCLCVYSVHVCICSTFTECWRCVINASFHDNLCLTGITPPSNTDLCSSITVQCSAETVYNMGMVTLTCAVCSWGVNAHTLRWSTGSTHLNMTSIITT